jgi:hypothetical protein
VGRSSAHQQEHARKAIYRVMLRAASIAGRALKDRTDAEIRKAFDLPTADAPKWTSLVTGITGAMSRAESSAPMPVATSLNITLVAAAPSTRDWLAGVSEQRKAIEPAKKVIDAVATETKPKVEP